MHDISNLNDDVIVRNSDGGIVAESDTEAKAADVLAALATANAMLASLFKLIDERQLTKADSRALLAGPYDDISELVSVISEYNYDELLEEFGIDVDKLEGRFPEIVRVRAFFAVARTA